MVSSVREFVPACHADVARANFRLSASPQVIEAVNRNLGAQHLFVIAILAFALIAVVCLTALFGSAVRRKAALDVLDRIMRWHW
jgi:threonine/homoserine/homoserine lactone efflux protein